MAHTLQSISKTQIGTAKMQYITTSANCQISEAEKLEDNLSLMISLCDSANNLYITLEKLYHIMKMKNLEFENKLKQKEKRLLSKATSPHANLRFDGAVRFTSSLEPSYLWYAVRKRLKKGEASPHSGAVRFTSSLKRLKKGEGK